MKTTPEQSRESSQGASMEGHSLGHCLPEVLGPWQDLLPLPPKMYEAEIQLTPSPGHPGF